VINQTLDNDDIKTFMMRMSLDNEEECSKLDGKLPALTNDARSIQFTCVSTNVSRCKLKSSAIIDV